MKEAWHFGRWKCARVIHIGYVHGVINRGKNGTGILPLHKFSVSLLCVFGYLSLIIIKFHARVDILKNLHSRLLTNLFKINLLMSGVLALESNRTNIFIVLAGKAVKSRIFLIIMCHQAYYETHQEVGGGQSRMR